ncbi:YciI family protein [Acuticoccus kandeliae]|uniref:YciI family protein n=1 Tax=Acuticoccus kandeliae TaxID=2073160 RepID=UPI000D3E7F25|nr:YciI family protein [Acuticoccus kandeliae]
MAFIIETWDKPDSVDLRMRVRPEHIEFLKANTHRLLGAGAKLSDDGETMLGTVYIVDTDSREEAESFVAQDPFSKAGLPGRIVATRWRKAFFNFEDRMADLK